MIKITNNAISLGTVIGKKLLKVNDLQIPETQNNPAKNPPCNLGFIKYSGSDLNL